MAILFSQSDGSDQHYDTYEEFEQAMILMKRLNGEEVPQDLLDEVTAKNSDKDTGLLQVKIDGVNIESAISEEVKKSTRELAESLDEVAKDVTPDSDEHEVPEKTHEFEVGDKVRVVGNNYGHLMDIGEVREITRVDSDEPKYRLSEISTGFWAGTSDIEHVHSSPKFQSGDVVKVTESFSDIMGDRVTCGAVYNYDEISALGETFVGTVFLGDNIDKLELVCRAQDRLDKY